MSIRVMIADDEEKVCQLIAHLADWKSLDMELVEIAHSGIEAMEVIRKWRPDIVITDIRMPGYSGLDLIREAKELLPQIEFIIISGYRHFEYAQTALRFGVKDYLLKPIRKDELNAALNRMRGAYMERNKRLSQEEMFRITLQNNLDRLRTGLFLDILLRRRSVRNLLDIERINRQYHYQFRPGCFQIVMLKIDGVSPKSVVSQEFLQKKVLAAFNSRIREYCFDSEICLEGYTCYAVLNYSEKNYKTVRRVLKQILDYLLIQNDIFERLQVTVGCGSVERDINRIRESLRAAALAAEERILKGTNRVLEYEKGGESSFAESSAFFEFNQQMKNAVENLDEQGVLASIDGLREKMTADAGNRGHDILQMAKEVLNVYLFASKENKYPLRMEENFFEDYAFAIDNMSSVSEIFAYVKQVIGGSFRELIRAKLLEDNRPVRMAKQFIKEKYGSPITLETVSDQVGLNAAYFSTLFKKETGLTFTEHLLRTRIEAAKDMLKDTNLSVAAICEKVGYSDNKHFSKTFMRETGLRPNQYRKLYS